jgi:hypothetical protein
MKGVGIVEKITSTPLPGGCKLQVSFFLQLSITQVKFPIIKSTQSFDLGIHNKGEVVHHGTHHEFDP